MPDDAPQSLSSESRELVLRDDSATAQDVSPTPHIDKLRHWEGGRCMGCEKPPELGQKLRACKGCRVARYCNAKCQRAHWAEHKQFCRRRGEVSDHFLGFTKFQQLHVLRIWVQELSWTLERIARTTVHLDGGVDHFLQRPQVMLFVLEAKSKDEFFGEGQVEMANLLRVTGSGVVPLDDLVADDPALKEAWDRDAAERKAMEDQASADGMGNPRYAGIMPAIYDVDGAGSIISYLPLYRFKNEEERPDERTRAALEDFVYFCKLATNNSWVMEPLKPGDAVVYPRRPAMMGEEKPAKGFLFRNWKTRQFAPSPGPSPWKTRLNPEALMRIYAALE